MGKILIIIGLFLNTAGAVILVIPILRTKVKLDEDYKIVETGRDKKGEPWFTRGSFKKNRCFSLWGLGLIILGFILQLLAQVLS